MGRNERILTALNLAAAEMEKARLNVANYPDRISFGVATRDHNRRVDMIYGLIDFYLPAAALEDKKG